MVWTEYHTLQYTIVNPICPPPTFLPNLNFQKTMTKKKKRLQKRGKDDIVIATAYKKRTKNMEATFESLGLSEAMLKALEAKGYGYPTTIQAEAA